MTPHIGKRMGVDDARTQLGQISFGAFWMPMVKLFGDGQPEYGVPEELQALVGGQAAVFVGVAAVGQRYGQQFLWQVDAQRLEQGRTVSRHVSSRSRMPVSLAQRGSICSWPCPGSAVASG